MPPVSLVLGANARAYVRGLVAFREGRVAEWCGVFSAAVRTAAEDAARLGRAIEGLRGKWRKAAREPRAGSTSSRVIDALVGYPILDVGTVERIAGVSNQAARLALLELEEAGVVKRVNTGKRNRTWEAVGLFEIVEAGERAGVGPSIRVFRRQ